MIGRIFARSCTAKPVTSAVLMVSAFFTFGELAGCGCVDTTRESDAGPSGDAGQLDCTPTDSSSSCPLGCRPHTAVAQPSAATCFDPQSKAWTGAAILAGCYPEYDWVGLPGVTCFRDAVSGTMYGASSTFADLALAPGIEPCVGVSTCSPDAGP